jgi:cation diffusion facilitator CzcD-associated flavoprotein CzcO
VEPSIDTHLLIVGAGPFGLAMAAEAAELGIDHVVLGEPMSFWKDHMPAGMRLRSGCDWHLDPTERDTLETFLKARGHTPADVEPLARDLYLEYAAWFERAKGIRPRRARVTRLEAGGGGFVAHLDDGSAANARNVLLALGFAPFAHVPTELSARIPAEHSMHSRDCVDPAAFSGRRVLIVGGRQSAFESAALLAEAGARVHVCHRHETPSFARSDWSWVAPLLERIGGEPGWYRALPQPERHALSARFWAEGRLKLEPWLGPRVHHEAISIRPKTQVTGYKVNLERVPFLAAGGLLDRIAIRDGFPVLDDTLQTSVPGLFVTSLPATRDFGLFFAFTAAVRASAHIVGRALTRDATEA